jgi:hypothetical protein
LVHIRRDVLPSTATRRARVGEIVHEWNDVYSGEAVSSIVRNLPCPPLALDPSQARFAVAGNQGIDVITIDVASLANT